MSEPGCHKEHGARVAQWVRSLDLTTHTSLHVSPIRLCKLQKRCSRLAAASDKVYQLLAHGRWFSPGTTASFTTKTGRHDIAEILLKVALNTKNQIKSNQNVVLFHFPNLFLLIFSIFYIPDLFRIPWQHGVWIFHVMIIYLLWFHFPNVVTNFVHCLWIGTDELLVVFFCVSVLLFIHECWCRVCLVF